MKPRLRKPIKKLKEPRAPKPPKARALTDELRARILEAYETMKSSPEPLRVINAQISEKLWVKRGLVMQAINEANARRELPLDQQLNDDQKKIVIENFSKFIEDCIRPPDGRHRTLAAQLGASVSAVRQARREWFKAQWGNAPDLTREQLFSIEKAYWAELKSRRLPLKEMPGVIASKLGFTPFQVMMWIDQLHDNENLLASVPDPTEEQRAAIIDAYHKYLVSEKPPENALHKTIGEAVGVTPRQVHKVLLRYRNHQRATYSVVTR